jgi:hypothetical protein
MLNAWQVDAALAKPMSCSGQGYRPTWAAALSRNSDPERM